MISSKIMGNPPFRFVTYQIRNYCFYKDYGSEMRNSESHLKFTFKCMYIDNHLKKCLIYIFDKQIYFLKLFPLSDKKEYHSRFLNMDTYIILKNGLLLIGVKTGTAV